MTRGGRAPSRTWHYCRFLPIRPPWLWPAWTDSVSLGRVLLAALAEAATGNDLVLALRQAADGLPAADTDLAGWPPPSRLWRAAAPRSGGWLSRCCKTSGSTSKGGRHGIAETGMERRLRPERRCARCRGSICPSTRTGRGAGPPAPGLPWLWSIAGSTQPTRLSAQSTGLSPCGGTRRPKRS